MGKKTDFEQNPDEKIVWFAIVGTYGFWVLGAVYLVAPVIGWVLFVRLMSRQLSEVRGPAQQLPLPLLAWGVAMGVMLLSLVVGHLDMGLGLGKLIKSSIGWAKGWALLALFPLVARLDIRPEVIYRAACVVCRYTVLFFPVFVAAWVLSLPTTLYVSPLKLVGGPGPEFFSVSLYELDPGSGAPRWRLFTPWAPALGMLGNLYFLCALEEKDPRWRRWGIAGSLLMIVISKSRLAMLCCIGLYALRWVFRYYRHPSTYFFATPMLLLAGFLGGSLVEKVLGGVEAIKSARADSTRVREALADIAIERWWNEAIWWGHGIVERGPHMVEYMPIGSHHTWYGLLFVKGLVGALALMAAFVISLAALMPWVGRLPSARLGVSILCLLLFYTLGENLEILAYLFWPGLILLGRAHIESRAEAFAMQNGKQSASL